MTIDKRTLNLLGLLVIVTVFALGALLFAKPMLDGVLAAQQEISTTQQTNQLYQTKLTELVAAEDDRAQLERDLARLRQELPATAQTGSMLQVIENALAAQGLQIESYSVGESFDFAPRVDPNADEEAQAAAAAATAQAADPAAVAESAAPADAADSAAAGDPAAQVPSAEPRQQFEVTLQVAVPDETSATTFLDALQQGPRLLLVTAANLQQASGDATSTLSVTLQVFYLSKESQ